MIRMNLILLFVTIFSLSAEAEVKVRILAKYSLQEIQIKSNDGTRIFSEEKNKILTQGLYIVKNINGKIHLLNDNNILQGKQILFISENTFRIIFSDKDKILSRVYKGKLEIQSINKEILLILKLPLEEYVSSATYSELGILLLADNFTTDNAKNELIAAQEITVRTYILNETKRHLDKKYDFCDLTHCMHFNGYTNKLSLYPKKILTGKSGVSGYFHSTCGGILAGPNVYWSADKNSNHYRKGKDGTEPNCKNSPQLNWESTLSNENLETILKEEGIILISLKLLDGRVKSIEYKNKFEKNISLPISIFLTRTGRLYGWNKIKSNLFSIEKIDEGYKFIGRGFGHGIGLCQWGAKYLADKGKSHNEILEFYFPETKIKLYDAD